MPSEEDYKRWNSDHCRWLRDLLTQIRTIRPGTSRQELLKIFTEEGGISHDTFQSFICRECSLIRVDVTFQPYDKPNRKMEWHDEEGDRHIYDPRDEVVKISVPQIGYPIWD
ncbi:MAG: hypothetical protein H8F28_02805 [Fibrella sp.]|nr:hypothetical protein [Armatimonadota bacterium]